VHEPGPLLQLLEEGGEGIGVDDFFQLGEVVQRSLPVLHQDLCSQLAPQRAQHALAVCGQRSATAQQAPSEAYPLWAKVNKEPGARQRTGRALGLHAQGRATPQLAQSEVPTLISHKPAACPRLLCTSWLFIPAAPKPQGRNRYGPPRVRHPQ
jgi:hypothetical protein